MNWTDFDAQTDEDIRAAIAKDPDAAPVLGPEWFATAEVVLPGRKRPISIRLDEDVLDYFQAQGEGYQSRINAVLKSYVRAQRLLAAQRALAESRTATMHYKIRIPEGSVIVNLPTTKESRSRETHEAAVQRASRVTHKHR